MWLYRSVNYRFFPVVCALAGVLVLSSCGDKPPEAASSESPAPSAKPAAIGSLSAGGQAPATPTAAVPPPTAVGAVDFDAPRPTVGHAAAQSDVDLLNHALERYKMVTPPGVDPADYAEKMNNNPITDLSVLVKAGLIKRLPTPPAGKQFVIDKKTHLVVLADK